MWVFAAWTVFVWGTRIRNILADDGLSPGLVVAVGLTVLGVLVAVWAARGRPSWAVPAAVVATHVVWAVRVPQIALNDHSAAFVAVHLVLAVVSVGLALATARTQRGPHGPASRRRTGSSGTTAGRP